MFMSMVRRFIGVLLLAGFLCTLFLLWWGYTHNAEGLNGSSGRYTLLDDSIAGLCCIIWLAVLAYTGLKVLLGRPYNPLIAAGGLVSFVVFCVYLIGNVPSFSPQDGSWQGSMLFYVFNAVPAIQFMDLLVFEMNRPLPPAKNRS